MKLSILICSLTSRAGYLARLLDGLTPQLTPEVEVLINCDNAEKLTGTKRQELLVSASGDYVAFVDDDDLVPPYYVEKILKAIESEPDYVGFQLHLLMEGIMQKPVYHSIKYDGYYDNEDGYYRDITHLNPIKRSIAIQFPYQNRLIAEDALWSKAVRESGLVKTEEYIEQPMYCYYFSRNKAGSELEPIEYDRSKVTFINE